MIKKINKIKKSKKYSGGGFLGWIKNKISKTNKPRNNQTRNNQVRKTQTGNNQERKTQTGNNQAKVNTINPNNSVKQMNLSIPKDAFGKPITIPERQMDMIRKLYKDGKLTKDIIKQSREFALKKVSKLKNQKYRSKVIETTINNIKNMSDEQFNQFRKKLKLSNEITYINPNRNNEVRNRLNKIFDFMISEEMSKNINYIFDQIERQMLNGTGSKS